MATQQAKILTINAKMQATIAGTHAQENTDEDRAKKMQDGLCWEDANFRIIGLDPNILPLDEAPNDEVARRKTCIFCAWIEDWEDEAVWPRGCAITEQEILSKYGGLRWLDQDNGIWFTAHPDKVSSEKKRGATTYELFGIMEGYEDGLPDSEHEDMWEEWFHDCAIDEIAEYYQWHPEEGVIVYK